MNNRTRQWFKANEMLDKYDPPVTCSLHKEQEWPTVKGSISIMVVKRSQLEEMKEEYGDLLEVWE